MTFLEDARRAVPAALRLYRFDAAAMSEFDLSFEGFIRSFAVLIPVAIIYLALCQVEFQHVTEVAGVNIPEPIAFFGWKMTGLVVDWFAFPIIMVPISRAMDLGHRYVPLIVAINWMAIVAIVIWTVPAFLFAFGLVGAAPTAFLSLLAFVYVVAATGFAIKTALDVPTGLAMALTVLYLILGLLIGAGVDRMIGV